MNLETIVFQRMLRFAVALCKAQNLLTVMGSIQKPQTRMWIEDTLEADGAFEHDVLEDKLINARNDIVQGTLDDGIESSKLAVLAIMHTATEEYFFDLLKIVANKDPYLIFRYTSIKNQKICLKDVAGRNVDNIIEEAVRGWVGSNASSCSMIDLFKLLYSAIDYSESRETLEGKSDIERLCRLDRCRHDAIHKLEIAVGHDDLLETVTFLNKLAYHSVLGIMLKFDLSSDRVDSKQAVSAIKK